MLAAVLCASDVDARTLAEALGRNLATVLTPWSNGGYAMPAMLRVQRGANCNVGITVPICCISRDARWPFQQRGGEKSYIRRGTQVGRREREKKFWQQRSIALELPLFTFVVLRRLVLPNESKAPTKNCMKTPSVRPQVAARVLPIALVALVLCGCKDPFALIPKADASGNPPFMTGTNCWISPRPFPLTPTELAEFKGILKGLDPNYYSIRFYSSGARALTDDDPMGTAGCYTNTEWGYIDAEVKKEGTSNAAAFVVNTGKSCFDTSSAQGVDFVQQVTKFFDDRRRAASKKAQ